MKKLLSIIPILLLLTSLAHAAGTVAQSGVSNVGDFKVVELTFAADASDASVPSTALNDRILSQIQGTYLYQVITDPGTTSPTDNYDIIINDANSLDIMGGNLADRDELLTEIAFPPTASRPVDGSLTFVLTNNAVNSATGTVKLYFSKTPGPGISSFSGGTLATAANQTILQGYVDDLETVLGTTSLVLATGADGQDNADDTLNTTARNMCWNGTTWDRCFSYNPCDRAARTQLAINQSDDAQIVAASAGEKIYVCSGVITTAADETITIVEGTGSVCATGQNALSGAISLPADGNGFIINYLQTNTASDALCILEATTADIDGWISYVQE